jgi:hypothetical protein
MQRKETGFVATLVVQSMTVYRIKEAQESDPKCTELKAMAIRGKTPHY